MKFNKLKKGLMVLSVCMLSLGAVACNKTEEVKNVNLEEVANTINTPELMNEQSVMVVDPKEHYLFEEVKDSIEDGFMIQAMINVKLNDVFVIKTSNPDAVMETIKKYKEESLRSFGDGYGGEDNITSVANSKLEKVGNYVYFIATVNSEEIENKLLETLK